MSYQNIPGLTKKAERDCMERWSLIVPHLPAEGVLLDIGAAEGAFMMLAAEMTGLFVIGLEKNPGRVRFHQQWLSDRNEGSVVSCRCNIGGPASARLAMTPEWFDAVLILSTLHWINSDEFLRNISSQSGRLFIEIPDLNDYKSTGQRFLERVRSIGSEYDYLYQTTGRRVRLLGQVKAHTSPTRKLWLIDGDLERKPTKPHIHFSGKSKVSYRQKYIDGRLEFITGKGRVDWVPGINMTTLASWNICWPAQEWWDRKIRESINKLNESNILGDLQMHNLIVSRDKFTWIDLDHRRQSTSIYSDIEGIVKTI